MYTYNYRSKICPESRLTLPKKRGYWRQRVSHMRLRNVPSLPAVGEMPLRGNCSARFLDYILPQTLGGFRRFL